MKKSIKFLTLFFIASLISIYLSNDEEILAENDTFRAEGQISSLVFGMPPSLQTVNMSSVEKFILSGYWKLVTDKGKLSNFTSEFYTGPVNGANNHTHLLTNMRAESNNPIKVSADGNMHMSGLIDVKINGESAWNDVYSTISITNARTISISLADNGTERHFMGQPIYGIVKNLTTMNVPSNDTILNSNMTNKSSSLNTTIPERLPPQSINGSNVPKI